MSFPSKSFLPTHCNEIVWEIRELLSWGLGWSDLPRKVPPCALHLKAGFLCLSCPCPCPLFPAPPVADAVFNSQEGGRPGPGSWGKDRASRSSLLIAGKTTQWGSSDPEGREPQKPGLLFDRSSNLPELGESTVARGLHPQRALETHTVDWTHRQIQVAIGKANAVFFERPAQLFHLSWWGYCQGPQQGHSWDFSESPKRRDCTPIP